MALRRQVVVQLAEAAWPAHAEIVWLEATVSHLGAHCRVSKHPQGMALGKHRAWL